MMRMNSRPTSTRWSLVGLLLLTALLVPVPATAQEPTYHRAGLVVVHGDGQVVTRCVTFVGAEITGIDLLARSGLAATFSPFGGLGYGVCAIDGEGCAAQDCFCQCQGSPCAYWTYSHRQPDGAWAISGLGASAWMLRDGDVDGWVWGDGSTTPPTLAFAAICPASATPASASGASSPIPGATPTPVATTPAPIASPTSAVPTAPPITSPTLSPSTPSPTVTPTATASAPTLAATTIPEIPAVASANPPTNYFLFAGLALSLLGTLVLMTLHRK